MNYYNEFDPKAAAWLRELINQKMIPVGVVDERSITEIKPHELFAYTQCHFFAGIGGWSLALQLAGWSADRPVWTGSCPCQPFSSAGKGLGDKDERHLWPVFFDLIRQCRPQHVFGEQVANAIGKGWLDGISADLESEGYACGASVLGAHSVGSPHIRQRLYWVADAAISGLSVGGHAGEPAMGAQGEGGMELQRERHCESGGLADAASTRCLRAIRDTEGKTRDKTRLLVPRVDCENGANHPWSNFDLIPCTDGKARRIEPGSFPLAHGVPERVGLLRGYGNAIVPAVAAEFVQAFQESISGITFSDHTRG